METIVAAIESTRATRPRTIECCPAREANPTFRGAHACHRQKQLLRFELSAACLKPSFRKTEHVHSLGGSILSVLQNATQLCLYIGDWLRSEVIWVANYTFTYSSTNKIINFCYSEIDNRRSTVCRNGSTVAARRVH